MTDIDLGTGARAYLRLLRYRPAAVPFLTALVARLPISMAPLGILLLVQSERGAYAVAGIVTGAFAVGSAVGTPVWGRLMDRVGQVRVLLPTAMVSAAFLIATALCTIGGAPTAVLIGLAAGAGLGYPPMSPAIRSAWRVVLPNPASRRVAFALDATAVELLFVGGPLLLSALLALTAPIAPLLVTAACMAGGAIGYCRTEAARHSPVRVGHPGSMWSGHRHHQSAITVPGVGAVFAVMLALSVAFGQLDTSMAATAGEVLGSTDRVGILFAAIAGGSAIGGLIYGSRRWPADERRTLPVMLSLFAVLLFVVVAVIATGHATVWVLLPFLFCTGLTIAPTLIMQQSLLDQLTPMYRLNEAQSMLSASNMVGAAVGTAIAGLTIDYRGLAWSFGCAGLAALVASVAGLCGQSIWRRSAAAVQPDGPTSPPSAARQQQCERSASALVEPTER